MGHMVEVINDTAYQSVPTYSTGDPEQQSTGPGSSPTKKWKTQKLEQPIEEPELK
jgi:hypothetical protein